MADSLHIGAAVSRSCADRGSPAMAGWRANPHFGEEEKDLMFKDKETRFWETGLVLAVPLTVLIASLLGLI